MPYEGEGRVFRLLVSCLLRGRVWSRAHAPRPNKANGDCLLLTRAFHQCRLPLAPRAAAVSSERRVAFLVRTLHTLHIQRAKGGGGGRDDRTNQARRQWAAPLRIE